MTIMGISGQFQQPAEVETDEMSEQKQVELGDKYILSVHQVLGF